MDTQDPREHEQLPLEHSPFSESAETGRFFSGGRRQEVLDGMVSALTGGIPIVTLTGDEGSGKTVLCRMLDVRIIPDYPTVYFPQTADSFEDVLKAIVQRLELATDQLPTDRAGLLRNMVSNLHDRNQRVLLIFDEAERIYLATLERVRKMLDLANHSGIFIQMVLSGRSGLHQNFKNLALCNFQPAEERHFSLEPLTDDETYEYLTFAMLDAVPEKRSIFSRKAAAAIFASSRGNLRSINRLADEVLRGYEGKELSSITNNGQEKQIREDRPRRRLKRPAAVLPKFALNWRHVAWGGGAACIVLAFLLFRPEEKTVGPQVEAVQDSETSIVISKPKDMERVEPDAEAIEQNGPEKQKKEETPVVHNGETISREQQPNQTPTPEAAEQAPAGIPTPAEPVVVSSPQQPETPSTGTRLQPEEKQQAIVQQEIPISEIAETEKTASADSIEPTVVASPQQPETPVAESGSEAEEKQPLAASTVHIPEQEVEKENKRPTPPVEAVRRAESAVETEVTEPIAVDTASQSGLTRQEVAVVTETSQPADATAEGPIVPPIIKAREVFKYREVLASANRGTITSQRIKILKQEDEPDAFELPATPISIRAVEQKKESELAPRLAPSTEQNPQVADPDKAAVLVSEKPRRTDSVDKIYTSRVAAGASWLSGLKDDRYTVRLMVITSGDAEKKLKTMLGEKNYREQADKFYILRRESNPGVQYVYYGEYPTMTAARNARNTIPEFLRGYKPYAMSVKGAVQRAQQEE